jgi:hypothetical protein
MDVQYLNTDLEIESESDLSKIVDEFGEGVLVLHHGEIRGYQHAYFEIAGSTRSASADDIINSFCSLVDGLSDEARKIWDGCCSRVLDIGYDSGTSTPNFRSEIRAGIKRVAKIGASHVITISPSRGDLNHPRNSR